MAQTIKCLPTMWETRAWSWSREVPMEKEMATHSSTCAWKIPWTEEPGYSSWGYKESDTTERLHFHFQCPAQGSKHNKGRTSVWNDLIKWIFRLQHHLSMQTYVVRFQNEKHTHIDMQHHEFIIIFHTPKIRPEPWQFSRSFPQSLKWLTEIRDNWRNATS